MTADKAINHVMCISHIPMGRIHCHWSFFCQQHQARDAARRYQTLNKDGGDDFLSWLSAATSFDLWPVHPVPPQAPLTLRHLHLWLRYTSGHSQSAEIIRSWINLDVHWCSKCKNASVCTFILIKDGRSDSGQIRRRWLFGTHHICHTPCPHYVTLVTHCRKKNSAYDRIAGIVQTLLLYI